MDRPMEWWEWYNPSTQCTELIDYAGNVLASISDYELLEGPANWTAIRWWGECQRLLDKLQTGGMDA